MPSTLLRAFEFVRSVNPIQIRWADYAKHITAYSPDSKIYLHLCPTSYETYDVYIFCDLYLDQFRSMTQQN